VIPVFSRQMIHSSAVSALYGNEGCVIFLCGSKVAVEYYGTFNLDYVIWQIVVQRMMVVLLLMMMVVIVIMVAAFNIFFH